MFRTSPQSASAKMASILLLALLTCSSNLAFTFRPVDRRSPTTPLPSNGLGILVRRPTGWTWARRKVATTMRNRAASAVQHSRTQSTGLPSDGSLIYATWWYYAGGQWQYIEYSYTAFGSSSEKGTITSPAPGSTFTGSSVTFTWTAGSGATAYWLDVGSTPGGSRYYQSGNLGNVLTNTVNGLPTNGSTVYVTLWSLLERSRQLMA